MENALHVPSVTGIDLELKIAGPGGRSYAYVVDWHIRLLLALAWYVVGTLIVVGSLNWVEAGSAAFTSFMWVVVLPASVVYFLYHPVLEILMQGRTPGKRIAGVRIVTQSGDVPGVGAILIRNVLRIVDSLPGVYAVGLAATMLTRQSVRIGDMAAGTLLVYESDSNRGTVSRISGEAIASVGLDQLELIGELLDRWQELDPDTRLTLGRRLLERLGEADRDQEADVLSALHAVRLKSA